MDPHRGFHRRFINKRQGLGGVLGSLLSGGSTSSSASHEPTTSAVSQNNGNPTPIVGGVTSLLGNVPAPSSGPSSPATSSTPLTHSSSSSTGSTTAPTSSTSSTSRTSTTSTTPTLTPTPTSTPTPSVSDAVYTSSDGTRIVYITSTPPTASASSSATAAPPTSFLQNPSLEGGVFALVGIVVLIIVFIIVTWAIRKRRRDRLERDIAVAVTFDPGATDHYERRENEIEKRRLSGSSSGHGHGYGYGYGVQPAYAPQQEYHGPASYGQYVAPYSTPSPNPAPYQAPSPAGQQPAEQGGANLTRKFSDRKPVPPLLPTPAYDPANAHVSIPPQFYQQ